MKFKECINEATEKKEIEKLIGAKALKNIIKNGIDPDDDVFQKLFDYYADSGEMPYGTMKARDGDPDVWIADRLADLK